MLLLQSFLSSRASPALVPRRPRPRFDAQLLARAVEAANGDLRGKGNEENINFYLYYNTKHNDMYLSPYELQTVLCLFPELRSLLAGG